MRATVFTDAALGKQAGRFVWLSIDTENEKNAAFLDRYPWQAVPTFQVIDAKTEKIAYSWIGAVDLAGLLVRFDEAETAFRRTDAVAAAAPSSVDASVLELALAEKHEECARRALELLQSLPPGIVRANVASTGLDCALSAPEGPKWRGVAVVILEVTTREAVDYEGIPDDDRSGLYGALVDARDRQHDEVGGQARAVQWLDWLNAQAMGAPSVEARAALDGNRVAAAVRAGRPELALVAIEASERDLPADYNPPARLAIVLREMGRYDDALAASDRALAKVYGPRTIRLWEDRATIFEKKGDPEGAKGALQKGIEFAASLPPSERTKRAIERLEKRLGEVGRAD